MLELETNVSKSDMGAESSNDRLLAEGERPQDSRPLVKAADSFRSCAKSAWDQYMYFNFRLLKI